MKRTILITVFAAMTAIFTVSCGGKEESKIPKNMDELWGTTWECKSTNDKSSTSDKEIQQEYFDNGYVFRVSFVTADSIVWAAYQLPDLTPLTPVVLTASTYTKPDLFYTKSNNYFTNFNDKPFRGELETPEKFCTFDEDGYLISNRPEGISWYYTKIK
ncbi:MAG: hypothetical protein LBR45_02755 [Bacteroidales bacterium]|jgi:hypothetical protein|nr:hypothetical protein [Bacteroidales bacterium]